MINTRLTLSCYIQLYIINTYLFSVIFKRKLSKTYNWLTSWVFDFRRFQPIFSYIVITDALASKVGFIYIKIGIFIASGSMNHLYNKSNQATVNGHKYSSPSILPYIFHIKPHFSIFFYCEVISIRILIIFAPEEAEILKDYLFILAWFSVRLPLFSYDLKTIFVFWRQICYIFNQNKIGKINICL